jgi:hypothetical protein
MLTNDTKASIDESVLCWLATADSNGAPKEIFTYTTVPLTSAQLAIGYVNPKQAV